MTDLIIHFFISIFQKSACKQERVSVVCTSIVGIEDQVNSLLREMLFHKITNHLRPVTNNYGNFFYSGGDNIPDSSLK